MLFVPSGAAVGRTTAADDECTPILDSSCFHSHSDGVVLSCTLYTKFGSGVVNHIANNHCLHG